MWPQIRNSCPEARVTCESILQHLYTPVHRHSQSHPKIRVGAPLQARRATRRQSKDRNITQIKPLPQFFIWPAAALAPVQPETSLTLYSVTHAHSSKHRGTKENSKTGRPVRGWGEGVLGGRPGRQQRRSQQPRQKATERLEHLLAASVHAECPARIKTLANTTAIIVPFINFLPLSNRGPIF